MIREGTPVHTRRARNEEPVNETVQDAGEFDDALQADAQHDVDRKSTRLNSSH